MLALSNFGTVLGTHKWEGQPSEPELTVTNDQTREVDLWCVAARLRDHPRFMAGWCAARPGAFRVLVDDLGLDGVRASRLMVCGVPRADRYDEDVAAIAEAVGVEPSLFAAAFTKATAMFPE